MLPGMRSRLVLFALLAVGLGLLGWAIFARETDEEAIRRRLDALAAAVVIVPDEAVVPRALRVRQGLQEGIERRARIDVPDVGVQLDRDELVAAAVQAGQRYRAGDVAWSDVRVEVRTGTEAHVEATAKLTATGGGGEPRSDERAVSLDLRKVEGTWLVTAIDVAPGDAAEPDDE